MTHAGHAAKTEKEIFMSNLFLKPKRLQISGLLAGISVLALGAILPPSAAAQSGPRASPELVTAAADAAAPIPPGPFAPTWDSLKANYAVPEWFRDAKFGIFMHWGLYSVPAYGSEWYAKHMYEERADAL
jgi:alpha-L-fucosidase